MRNKVTFDCACCGAENKVSIKVDISPVTEITRPEISFSVGEAMNLHSLSIKAIIEKVADMTDISVVRIKGNIKTKEVAGARRLAMYMSRKLTGASFPEIARAFGKNHSTVFYAVQKMEECSTEKLEYAIAAVSRRLGAGLDVVVKPTEPTVDTSWGGRGT